MDQIMRQRGAMALLGALAGGSLYLLGEVLEQGVLPDRAALGLTAFAAVFFGAVLAMAGPLNIPRAALGAASVALVAAGLLVLASLRFDDVDGLFGHPAPAFAFTLLASIPLPFLIAAAGPGWRDYPTLFSESWGIVVRSAAAWVFVAVVWALIFLSDALLALVGITLIDRLIDIDIVPFLITGITLGLALAVVVELGDVVSPYLILRLLRLLLPVVLAVMALFILALPVQGLSRFLGGLSVAATLLAMAVAAATLVTSAIDRTAAEAVAGPLMLRATQGLALMLPVPAALAAYAIWLRVDQHGWTPDRLFAAKAAVLALGYGVIYALAVLRGAGWMDRIRQGNVTMALALLVVSALWLTPLLNAEAISARDQLARFEDGRVAVADLDVTALENWGRPGAAALDALRATAAEPGQGALAARLENRGFAAVALPETAAGVLTKLRATLPLQPPTATPTRDRLLDGFSESEHRYWLGNCLNRLPDGRPGCAMLVGDFWPGLEGEEAVLISSDPSGYLVFDGLVTADGRVQRRGVAPLSGNMPLDAAGAIGAVQSGAVALTPAPLNQITLDGQPLIIAPY
ncbi:DUF4153 domain-containing protein [Fertoebacter nigrum]|uniref:DUF4153 domain-containing protein n=1 Tax=Fertoeibacter niger TaxID=2656921 RepID=A0A8X8H5Z0_9RHOB|nr:DUF4153 domain-containing protein [Fertoeibacter niger]NUB46313.1 DUF4153 domain-containing protein [Fertoeibacter niger]